jgi:two-component system sensor histidine kinase KdpD
MARGTLRVYLGAAPGVGKTYAMLGEGHRRLERGTDVVVGLVETHGRAQTAQLVEGLEVVPRRTLRHRGAAFTEMDVDAVLARHPEVALVDELAHTNVPGSRNAKRWQDVEELLEAGIDVITTVNIQHLESLNDVVESITGIRQQETVPDDVVRRADQIELEDMSPQALRRRLAHGNVYAADKVDAALTNYFRVGNLTALRELALLWLADRVDDALELYRAEHDITEPWPTRERVVVALSGGAEGDALVRRGARIAERAMNGELLVLHVSRADGLTEASPDTLARQRLLAESLGGTWHAVVGDDVAASILEFARGVNASQIILGATRRGRLGSFVAPGPGAAVVRDSGDIDVHIVTHTAAGERGHRVRRPPRLGRRRRFAGWLLATVGVGTLTLGLVATQDLHGLPTVMLLYLALTIGVALVGGMAPAVCAALASGLLANYFFTPPVSTFTIGEPENALALLVMVAVAVAVSLVVDLAARRSAEAARARAEADTLSALAGSVLRGADAVPALLERLRESLALTSVALEQRGDGGWRTLDAARTDAPGATREESGDTALATLSVTEDLRLVLRGKSLDSEQTRIANVVAAQVEAVLERDQLRTEARAVRAERERTAIRTALLAAVSHDLRTPLAGIKAGASALRSSQVELDAADQHELLGEIEDAADRLQALIDNLLDLSRLDSGAVQPRIGPVALDEVVPLALRGVPPARVNLDVPDALPLVLADEGLLERALANVVENAVRYSPPDVPVSVSAAAVGARAIVRVADRGRGVPDEHKGEIFRAFQRLGDAPSGQGVGLGLAVARGFVEACGGTLDAEDTPGGGLTLVLTLPVVDVPAHPRGRRSGDGGADGVEGAIDGAVDAGGAVGVVRGEGAQPARAADGGRR